MLLFVGSVHSFSNGRAGYSHPNQHRHSGHEREEERGDVCLSGFDLNLLLEKEDYSHIHGMIAGESWLCRNSSICK